MNSLNAGERDRYPSSHNRRDEESSSQRHDSREVYSRFFPRFIISFKSRNLFNYIIIISTFSLLPDLMVVSILILVVAMVNLIEKE